MSVDIVMQKATGKVCVGKLSVIKLNHDMNITKNEVDLIVFMEMNIVWKSSSTANSWNWDIGARGSCIKLSWHNSFWSVHGLYWQNCTRQCIHWTEIQVPNLKGTHNLKLKIDTGASGNTLPIRTYHQMFGDKPFNQVLKPVKNITLSAYNGQTIQNFNNLTS